MRLQRVTHAPAQPPAVGSTPTWQAIFAVLLTLGGGAGVKASMSSDDAATSVRALTTKVDALTDALATQRIDAAAAAATANALVERLERLERTVYGTRDDERGARWPAK